MSGVSIICVPSKANMYADIHSRLYQHNIEPPEINGLRFNTQFFRDRFIVDNKTLREFLWTSLKDSIMTNPRVAEINPDSVTLNQLEQMISNPPEVAIIKLGQNDLSTLEKDHSTWAHILGSKNVSKTELLKLKNKYIFIS